MPHQIIIAIGIEIDDCSHLPRLVRELKGEERSIRISNTINFPDALLASCLVTPEEVPLDRASNFQHGFQFTIQIRFGVNKFTDSAFKLVHLPVADSTGSAVAPEQIGRAISRIVANIDNKPICLNRGAAIRGHHVGDNLLDRCAVHLPNMNCACE